MIYQLVRSVTLGSIMAMSSVHLLLTDLLMYLVITVI